MRNRGWSTTRCVVTFGVLDILMQDNQPTSVQINALEDYPYSPTQIDIFLSCERKWAFRYIEKLRPESTPSAILGTEIHRQLEEYVAHGTPFLYSSNNDLEKKAASIAETALEHLPPLPAGEPIDGRLVTERQFEFIGLRHRYQGKKDLTDVQTGIIYDYKSTSDFKWLKPPAVLKSDIQAVIYGIEEMVARGSTSVPMRWIYMRTKGKPVSKPIDLEMRWEEAWPVFEVIEDVVDEIAKTRSRFANGELKRALDLAPSPGTCEKYGGCPWRGVCNLSPMERIHAMANAGMSATEALLARLKNAQTTAVQPNAVNPPEAAQAPAPQPPPPAQESIETPAAPAEEPKAAAKRVRRVKVESDAAKGKNKIGTLFINCVETPSTGEKRFEHLLALANEKIRATKFTDQDGREYSVTDYRFIPFGQGGAVLLAAVEETLTELGRQEELWIDSGTPEATVVLNALAANADRVVRGTR